MTKWLIMNNKTKIYQIMDEAEKKESIEVVDLENNEIFQRLYNKNRDDYISDEHIEAIFNIIAIESQNAIVEDQKKKEEN